MVSIDVNAQTGVLTLNIDAPLASANMRNLSDRAEVEIARAEGLKAMIIQAPHFPSWRDLSGLLDRLRGLQAFRAAVSRVAVVTESSPMEFAAQLASYFPGAEIDRFSAQRMDRADAWVLGHNAAEGDSVVMYDAPEPVAALDDEPGAAAAAVVELEDVETEAGEEDDWFV